MRLRNLAALRAGVHLLLHRDGMVLSLPASETKARRFHEAPVAELLADRLRGYLRRHRPVLLRAGRLRRGAPADALWISKVGTALGTGPIGVMIRKRTRAAFGRPVWPHLYRACAATTIAIRAPEETHIIPGVLGHATSAASERYYNLAGGLEAARAHSTVLAELRELVGQARLHERPSKAP
jgi:integrase